MTVLIDSDVLIAVLRGRDIEIRSAWDRLRDSDAVLMCSPVTVAELWDGSPGRWELDQLDFLFIENVGNLVCPASYDVGEDLRVVLLSVIEGEDKPLKYPTIFNTADLVVLIKMDLAEAAEFDLAAARDNVHRGGPVCHS
jgi:hydrogenase accessory protein HypB